MADNKINIDDIDEKIIYALRRDGRITMKRLGELVHLTGQAAKNRVERLEDLGIVQRYTVNVNCPVYGYKVHALIDFVLQRGAVAALLDFLQQQDVHVLHFYQLGSDRFMLDSYFYTIEELQNLLPLLEKYGSYKLQLIIKDLVDIEN